MYTDSPALSDEDIPNLDPLDAIEIETNVLMTLPNGWKMAQMKVEQPATTYEMFKREILNEIARCLNMPANIATMSSANHNFSSGKLDHLIYEKSIEIERSYFEQLALDKIFSIWLSEASLIPGYLPDEMQFAQTIPHQWFWDGFGGVEPVKEANAIAIALATGVTSLEAEYAKKGLDVDLEMDKAAHNLGITLEEYQALVRQKIFSSAAMKENEQETDEEKEKTKNEE